MARTKKPTTNAIDATEHLNINVTQADIDAANAIRDEGKLNPGETPSERLFSIALSRQLGGKVKVTFSEDKSESFVEYLDGH